MKRDTQIKCTEELEKFLRKNRMYRAFCRNVVIEKGLRAQSITFKGIDEGFSWALSTEEYECWRNLDEQFKKIEKDND